MVNMMGQVEQFVQHAVEVDKDGTVLDFASDYPGVMVVLVGFLVAVCWFLVKRKRGKT